MLTRKHFFNDRVHSLFLPYLWKYRVWRDRWIINHRIITPCIDILRMIMLAVAIGWLLAMAGKVSAG
jgi:hypothetical protein